MFFKESKISTPDLRDKFIRCAESFDLSAEKTGGGGNSGVKNQVKLMVSNLPEHSHKLNPTLISLSGSVKISIPEHSHYVGRGRRGKIRSSLNGGYIGDYVTDTKTTLKTSSAGGSTQNCSLDSGSANLTGIKANILEPTVQNNPFSIEPEYYALMFIMKIRNN